MSAAVIGTWQYVPPTDLEAEPVTLHRLARPVPWFDCPDCGGKVGFDYWDVAVEVWRCVDGCGLLFKADAS